MNRKEPPDHLPMCGVGPVFGITIIACTVLAITLTCLGLIPTKGPAGIGRILSVPGAALILGGAFLWYAAVFRAKIDDGILNNRLVTTGVYAWVRNPIYTAFLMFCTGALLISGNLLLLFLPPVYWAFLTLLMKHTEEKWLAQRYGQPYLHYCERVNRCIPWPPRRSS